MLGNKVLGAAADADIKHAQPSGSLIVIAAASGHWTGTAPTGKGCCSVKGLAELCLSLVIPKEAYGRQLYR